MELIAVVAIIGVLATIAVYSLRKYIQYSKTAEAGEIIGAIKAGEEAYFDETFRYLSAADSGNPEFYPDSPTGAPGSVKIQWGGAGSCTGCAASYRTLGVMPNAAVLFRYTTTAGEATDNASGALPSSIDGNPFGNGAAGAKFYVVTASSDLDDSGADFTAFVGSNLMGDLYSEKVGQ